MKEHRTLTRERLLREGPARISLMAASEFGRASSRAANLDNVKACYARARELMGILETISLPLPVAFRLKPVYQRMAAAQLLQPSRLEPRFIGRCCAELADEFSWAARQLSRLHERSMIG